MAAPRAIDLLALMGVVEDPDAPEVRALQERIDAAGAVGIDGDALRALVQAYGRGIGRIAGAGAEVAVRRLQDIAPEEREAQLRAWLDELLPLATMAFDALHGPQLERLARRRLSRDAPGDLLPTAVAFVDLRGSTAYLVGASPDEARALADDLYFAAQAVAVEHGVVAGKFLGDGVLLVSRESARLVDAAKATVEELCLRTPLPAGGGVAHGDVLRRAGDYFGVAVNLAARLSELADPRTVLVDETAVPPGHDVDGWRDVLPRGLTSTRRVAVLRCG